MDWATASSLATAGGTLVLAAATFTSIRSANRAARVAEVSVMANLRPLLMHSRLDDHDQKVGFHDGKWFHVPGGMGAAEVTDEAVYLVMSLRNVASGTALLHGWWLSEPNVGAGLGSEAPPLEEMNTLTRDIFVPGGDVGFWQGSFREPTSSGYALARRLIEANESIGIAVMYGDLEGGQRTITRFNMIPRAEGDLRLVAAGRVWNIDRPASR
jgi:hypothetical protein